MKEQAISVLKKISPSQMMRLLLSIFDDKIYGFSIEKDLSVKEIFQFTFEQRIIHYLNLKNEILILQFENG